MQKENIQSHCAMESNHGLNIGDIVTEVRKHPFITGRKGLDYWDFKEEVLRFEVIEVLRHEYKCRYIGEENSQPFFWPFWDKQPNNGFWLNDCSVVRYYAPTSDNKKINYQIMAAPAADGKYYPNYEALIAGASCEEEVKYLNEVKKRNSPFAYNMVYVTRQTCGHFEIFQTPQNEHYPLEYVLVGAIERATERKCTRCICNW